ncbi:MAG: hypothetical protein Q7V40_21155 [Pseudolabrys sp.]|nr:hypothetical protein [Pseudolabrys sp.]
MDAFIGIASLSGAPIHSDIENQAVRAVSGGAPRGTLARRGDHALFVHGRGEAGLPPPGRGGNLFAAVARLDNRAELAEALGRSAPSLALASDEALLSQMFERWGGGGVARCLGAFGASSLDMPIPPLMCDSVHRLTK